MKTRTKGLIGIAVVLVGATLTLESSTRTLRGCWRGEAFYRLRPTSYWSEELQHWRLGFT